MHAQQAGRRSGTGPNLAAHERDGRFRSSPRNRGPVENRNEHRGRQLDGRLLARHHLHLVLATCAVVLVGVILGRDRALMVIATGITAL
ncbi:MAG: hypothetical protein ACK562_09105 [Acidobacteriota bacterium]